MPRPFRFPLQKVLEYRSQLEEEAKLELAKAQHNYAKQGKIINALRSRFEEHKLSLNKKGGATADDWWLWKNYAEGLQADLKKAEERLLELAKELNKRRREAVAAARDHKLLEKLKQKQAAKHVKEEERKEQNEFDEMATIRYKPQNF